jgi:hypothetical protein
MVKRNEARCFCAHAPLLALFGIDDAGEAFIHVKVHKGGKLYHEALITGGKVRIKCRSCLRWHRLNIIQGKARLEDLEELDLVMHGLSLSQV